MSPDENADEFKPTVGGLARDRRLPQGHPTVTPIGSMGRGRRGPLSALATRSTSCGSLSDQVDLSLSNAYKW